MRKMIFGALALLTACTEAQTIDEDEQDGSVEEGLADVKIEGEAGTFLGTASAQPQAGTSGGAVAGFIGKVGNGVRYSGLPQSSGITLRYATALAQGRLALYVNGAKSQDVVVPGTGSWYAGYQNQAVSVQIPQNATIELRFETGGAAFNIDYLLVTPSATSGGAKAIMADMGVSEGKAHGIESWQQSKAAMVENALPAGWTAAGGWGQVYRDTTNSGDTNTRVALKDFRVYLLDKSGHWHTVVNPANSAIQGGHFPENYSGSGGQKALRVESDGSLSDKLQHGYNFHFFGNRFSVDPANMAGILARVSARLVVDNPTKPDDRHLAKYLFNMGADWWKTTTIGYCGWSTNPAKTCNYEVGFSKFKYVTNDWKTVNFTNLTEAQLTQYPPPN